MANLFPQGCLLLFSKLEHLLFMSRIRLNLYLLPLARQFRIYGQTASYNAVTGPRRNTHRFYADSVEMGKAVAIKAFYMAYPFYNTLVLFQADKSIPVQVNVSGMAGLISRKYKGCRYPIVASYLFVKQ